MSEQKGAPQLAYGQLGGESRVHVEADGVVVTDLAGTRRVLVGQLTPESGTAPATYGLRVVSSDGTTVIIDGTSDMFRIAATGTTTITGPTAGGTTNTNVDFATGFTYPPAYLCFCEITVATSNQIPLIVWDLATGTLSQEIYAKTAVFNTNQTRLSITWRATTNQSASTFTVRYYILEQVGL